MMEDTPSNYNIANGRLEGKSMGLKAILLYAKNQGINIAENGTQLQQIREEGVNDSGENQWRNMNNPLHGVGTTHIIGETTTTNIQGGTIIHEERKVTTKTKRNPVQKQFLEQSEGMTPLKKNNFVKKQ
jgi:hypothetical protein